MRICYVRASTRYTSVQGPAGVTVSKKKRDGNPSFTTPPLRTFCLNVEREPPTPAHRIFSQDGYRERVGWPEGSMDREAQPLRRENHGGSLCSREESSIQAHGGDHLTAQQGQVRGVCGSSFFFQGCAPDLAILACACLWAECSALLGGKSGGRAEGEKRVRGA